MIEILSGFPDDVLAVRFSGEITAEDYHNSLIPTVHERFKTHKTLKIYSEVAAKTALSPAAMWEDLKLGIEEWGHWGHAAVVSDEGWVRAVTMMMKPFFHPPVRLFSVAETADAKRWILNES